MNDGKIKKGMPLKFTMGIDLISNKIDIFLNDIFIGQAFKNIPLKRGFVPVLDFGWNPKGESTYLHT